MSEGGCELRRVCLAQASGRLRIHGGGRPCGKSLAFRACRGRLSEAAPQRLSVGARAQRLERMGAALLGLADLRRGAASRGGLTCTPPRCPRNALGCAGFDVEASFAHSEDKSEGRRAPHREARWRTAEARSRTADEPIPARPGGVRAAEPQPVHLDRGDGDASQAVPHQQAPQRRLGEPSLAAFISRLLSAVLRQEPGGNSRLPAVRLHRGFDRLAGKADLTRHFMAPGRYGQHRPTAIARRL